MNFNRGVAEGGAACGSAIDLVVVDGQPPKRVQLLPLGELHGRDGRRWKVEGKAHAQRIVEASKAYARSQDMAVDYDHQSVFGAKDGVGGKAPASGWVKPATLTVEDDGIWADVEWTARAAAAIVAKEYRYLSPFFGFDKAGKVTRIFNAGLTNNPNFELAAVASSDLNPNEESQLDKTKLAQALGLGKDATEEQILAAITEQSAAASAAQTSLKAIATAAGLEETAEATAVASAVAGLKTAGAPDPSKYAPKEVVDGLVAQVTQLTKGQTEDKATAAVEQAVNDGKLTPALAESWATPYALKDLAGFTAWASAAPVVVPLGEREDLSGEPEGGSGVLSAEDKATCSVLGLSEEDFLKTKKGNA